MNKDIYFTKEWAQLFAQMENGCPENFTFSCGDGRVSYSFIRKKKALRIDNQDYYDIISPGGFGGPYIMSDSHNLRNLAAGFDKAFDEYCQNEHIVTEYVRFSPITGNASDFKNCYDLIEYEDIYYKDLTSDDILTREMPPKMRSDIKKAQECGMTVSFDFTGDTIQEFISIYHKSGNKNNLSFDASFIEEGFRRLRGRIFIINAIYENEIIASGIFLQYSGVIHCHYITKKKIGLNLNSSSMIIYSAALWGKRHSKKCLDIGRLSRKTASELSLSKKDLLTVYAAKKIRMPEIYKIYSEASIKIEQA
ncbi:MAG: peptidoglycan bridge formation glycyltransferase FemA/FemB family protein [Oscillospiraceae bacterium]|nr:peptidoglycan bridge formation glycyltransferase FemA/FemB family protein [Oscillospiraceae bacterium]